MKMEEKPGHGYIRKQTALILSAVMFFTGFFAGVLLTVYKTVNKPHVSSEQHQPADREEGGEKRAAMIETIKDEIRKHPEKADLWANLGNLHFDSGQHEEAIEAYKKSLEIEPKNPNVLTDLGVMYRRHGNPKKAVESFSRANEADPRHETSLFNKGIVLFHDLNSPEAAIDSWKKLLEVNPMAMSPDGRSVKELIKVYSSMAAEKE